MLENFVQFLKKTFTYAEESNAQTPPTVSSAQAPAQQPKPQPSQQKPAQPRVAPAPEIKVRKANTIQGESDPQKAAKQQADNFAALRPKPGDNPFRMTVDKVFYAKGSGVVVKGVIGQGIAKAGTRALIVHAANKTTIQTRVLGIEKNGQLVNSAPAGSTVGLLLDQVTRNDVHARDVIGEIPE